MFVFAIIWGKTWNALTKGTQQTTQKNTKKLGNDWGHKTKRGWPHPPLKKEKKRKKWQEERKKKDENKKKEENEF